MKKIVFLILITTSHFLHAELQVWAFKGQVWTWSDEGYKNGHYVQVGEKLSENSKLDLRTVDSYVALLNTTTHKLIELKGNVYHNYEQLQELENQAKELPPLNLELVKHKYPVYRGCRCIGSRVVRLYPVDANQYYVSGSEPVTIHYEFNPELNQRYQQEKLKEKRLEQSKQKSSIKKCKKRNKLNQKDPLVFQVTDMMGNILSRQFLDKTISSGDIEISTQFLPKNYEEATIIQLVWRQEETEKAIKFTNSTNNSIDFENMNFAEKVYFMVWMYQKQMTVEGYALFKEVGDLSAYKGFDTYYQDLYKYYVQEENN